VNRLLLNSLDAELLQFLIKDLTQIHDDGFVDLLPQMGSENLNKGDLQCRDLAMEEYACEIQLDLETNINICSIYRGTEEQLA
jgi:hypothetical protein